MFMHALRDSPTTSTCLSQPALGQGARERCRLHTVVGRAAHVRARRCQDHPWRRSVAASFSAPLTPGWPPRCMAVERAFAWYLDEAVGGQGAAGVRGRRRGRCGRRWRADAVAARTFDHLVTFAQAMYRLAPMDASDPRLQPGRLPDGAEPRRLDIAPRDRALAIRAADRSRGVRQAGVPRDLAGDRQGPAGEPRGLVGARPEEPVVHRAGRRQAGAHRRWRWRWGPGTPFDLPLAALARRFQIGWC